MSQTHHTTSSSPTAFIEASATTRLQISTLNIFRRKSALLPTCVGVSSYLYLSSFPSNKIVRYEFALKFKQIVSVSLLNNK
jgi:hypothetical protein